MSLQPRQWVALDRDSPPVLEYGSLYLLLLAVTAVQLSLNPVLDTLTRIASVLLGQRLFEAAVYTVLLLSASGVAYAVVARTTDTALDRFELTRIGVSLAGLLVVALYYLSGQEGLPGSATQLLGPLVATATFWLLAVVYARNRGFDIRLGLPESDVLPTVVAAVVAPALVVAAAVGVALAVPAVSVRWLSGAPFDFAFGGISPVPFVYNIVLPSVVGATGTGVLYYGAIHESLRRTATAAQAVAAVTVLVGTYRLAVTSTLGLVTGPVSLLAAAVAVALVVLAALLVGHLWTHAAASISETVRLVAAAALGVTVVTLLAVAVQLTVSMVTALVGFAVAQAAVVGIAAVVYERSRSVWLPVLTFVTFQLTVAIVQRLQLVPSAF